VWRHRVDLPLTTVTTVPDDSALVRMIFCSTKYKILQYNIDILMVECRRQMQHTNTELQSLLYSGVHSHRPNLADILAARQSLMNARKIYHSATESLPFENMFAAYAVDATTLQVHVCVGACVCHRCFSVISLHCIKQTS
jgi:hypothetical protein